MTDTECIDALEAERDGLEAIAERFKELRSELERSRREYLALRLACVAELPTKELHCRLCLKTAHAYQPETHAPDCVLSTA